MLCTVNQHACERMCIQTRALCAGTGKAQKAAAKEGGAMVAPGGTAARGADRGHYKHHGPVVEGRDKN